MRQESLGIHRIMGDLGDRLAKADDDSVIYRADTGQSPGATWKAILAVIVGTVIGSVLTDVFNVGALVTFSLAVAVVVGYVLWRRRRNEHLTGSPTQWPDSS